VVAEEGGQGRELTGELPGTASVGTITIALLFPNLSVHDWGSLSLS